MASCAATMMTGRTSRLIVSPAANMDRSKAKALTKTVKPSNPNTIDGNSCQIGNIHFDKSGDPILLRIFL